MHLTMPRFRLLTREEFERLSVGQMVVYQRELDTSQQQQFRKAKESSMDWSTIQSRWDEYKVAAKRRWDKLSEQQLHTTRGHRNYLLRRVQEAYSLTAEEADRELAAWQDQVLAARQR